MKAPNLIIQIPEPCHENWNTMQPDATGKFCSSCSKSVIDFSNKTDLEIHTILLENKDKRVCGHFKKTQVNRPLSIRIDLRKLPKNMSSTSVFAISLFLVFGTLLFSCTNHNNEVIGLIEAKHEMYTTGMPIPPPQELLTGDTVIEITLPPDTVYDPGSHLDGEIEMEEIMMGKIVAPDTALIPEPMLPDSTQMMDRPMLGMMEVVTETPDSSFRTMNAAEDSQTITESAALRLYPNPSGGEFTMQYALKEPANIRIDVYDLGGAWLRTLVNMPNQYRGQYRIPVVLNDLPNGIYLVNMIRNGERFTENVIVQK